MIHQLDHARTKTRAHRPAIVYRFPVRDAKTGATYFVVVQEDGLAYREEAAPELRVAV